MSDRVLNGSFPLPRSYEPKVKRRGWEESIAGLEELVDHEYVGPAARTALRCVEERDGDPRLMLLIVEAAIEGYFAPQPKQERDRQRNAQKETAPPTKEENRSDAWQPTS